MPRDLKLLQRILELADAGNVNYGVIKKDDDNVSPQQYVDNARILDNGKYITGQNLMGGGQDDYFTLSVTAKGYEYLDELKADSQPELQSSPSIEGQLRVFYSWQSDSPHETGKKFIRDALDMAVISITEELELSEAARPLVDQDTQGVKGDPPIADVIFEKIRNSDVIVVDVTMVGEQLPETVGKKKSPKMLINSNVAYELGFAHGHHGYEPILKIMNTHYGPADDLPFDLQHRRFPVTYHLAPDADSPTREKILKKLAKELAKILALYTTSSKESVVEELSSTPSTMNAATYWDKDEVLFTSSRRRQKVDYKYEQDALMYLRFSPNHSLPELSVTKATDFLARSGAGPFIRAGMGFSPARNRFGPLTFPVNDEGNLQASTQLFFNREIWGVDTYILGTDKLMNREQDADFKFIPDAALEGGLEKSLEEYSKLAFDFLDYGEVANVEFGMVNCEGFCITTARQFDKMSDNIHNDIRVVSTIRAHEPRSIKDFIDLVMDTVFDAAGETRKQ